MIHTEYIDLAKMEQLEQIHSLFEACKQDLFNKEIYQWDAYYPNKEYLAEAIQNKELHVMKHQGKIVGAVVLNEWQSEEWSVLSWDSEGDQPLVIHSLCIHPNIQGKGMGQILLNFCEEYAYIHAYNSIRLDAFSKNNGALSLYEKNKYEKIGQIIFPFKPADNQIYYCYEKLI